MNARRRAAVPILDLTEAVGEDGSTHHIDPSRPRPPIEPCQPPQWRDLAAIDLLKIGGFGALIAVTAGAAIWTMRNEEIVLAVFVLVLVGAYFSDGDFHWPPVLVKAGRGIFGGVLLAMGAAMVAAPFMLAFRLWRGY